MSQFSKPWEELNFSDNFIFCKVMKEKVLCKRMLEILLGIQVKEISYIETEHSVDEYYQHRGIRMDVYLQDSDKIYDIEMQTGNYDDLLMRARYYLSASDVSSTPRRTRFKDLKETYIIFICKDDPFGQNLPLYTEEKRFKETDKFKYDDKSYKLFYNASAYENAQNKEVSKVLEFIYTLNADSDFTKNLKDSVIVAKKKPIFKDEYMYFMDIVEEEKEKVAEIAFEKGSKKGEIKAKLEAALNLFKNGVSYELIEKSIGITKEQIEEELKKQKIPN